MPGYRIGVEAEADSAGLDLALLVSLVERVLAAEEIPEGAGIGILLTGDERMRDHNRQYRGIDAPTDVLSFELANDDEFADDDAGELGDVIVSLDSARRQAEEHRWSLQQEVEHLVVHAVLHLCGHDHEASAEAEVAMRAREERYLGPLGNVHS